MTRREPVSPATRTSFPPQSAVVPRAGLRSRRYPGAGVAGHTRSTHKASLNAGGPCATRIASHIGDRCRPVRTRASAGWIGGMTVGYADDEMDTCDVYPAWISAAGARELLRLHGGRDHHQRCATGRAAQRVYDGAHGRP